MITTKLQLEDFFPLTCSRAGTCCHGKTVFLNPWELANIAREKKLSPKEFSTEYCEWGGIKLIFNGESTFKNQSACSQYIENFGCSVHLGRPLACRLYPLGRKIQNQETHYIHEGIQFPCLADCPTVITLPQMTVGNYLKDQSAEAFEIGQDNYLKLVQQLADIAFELYLDSGLAASGNRTTLESWKNLGLLSSEELPQMIREDWLSVLIFPEINTIQNPTEFTIAHSDILFDKAQTEFGIITTMSGLETASILMMAVALQLARSIGADAPGICEHWVETAKKHL